MPELFLHTIVGAFALGLGFAQQGGQDPVTPEAPAGEETPANPALPPALLLRGGTVHSMTPGEAPRRADVLIEGDRIRALGEISKVPADAMVIDLEGKHLIPGLIDGLANHDSDHDALYVAAGVTLIRDNGNQRMRILLEREREARDRVPGPDLFIAGLILDGQPPATNESVVLADEVVAATLLPQLLEDDLDFFSVHRGIPVGAWRRAIRVAHEAGIELWGFLPAALALEDALGAHMDGLFGLDGFLPAGKGWGQITIDELAPRIAAAAKAGLEVTPLLDATAVTLRNWDEEPAVMSALSPHYLPLWRARIEEIRATPPEMRESLQVTLARESELLVKLHAAGVHLVPGSGAPNVLLAPGEALLDELDLWVSAGLTAETVLELATHGAAEALGISEERGSIAAGRLADVVVLAADPSVDLAALRRPELVVVRGRPLDRAALDERLDALRAAQAEQQAELARPLDVPLPVLPEGDVVLEARYESLALGLRVSAEHLAVVRTTDGATAYCTRMISPGGPTSQGTEVELCQRVRDEKLESFDLAIRGGGIEVTIKGLLIGGLLQVERRTNGFFQDNNRASKPIEVVDIGSALTDVLIAQRWTAGRHYALYFEGIDPVESEWAMEIAADDHRFLVSTGQGPLVTGFDEHGAPLFSFRRAGNAHTELRRLDVRTFGGPGLALPPERVFVHPEDASSKPKEGEGR